MEGQESEATEWWLATGDPKEMVQLLSARRGFASRQAGGAWADSGHKALIKHLLSARHCRFVGWWVAHASISPQRNEEAGMVRWVVGDQNQYRQNLRGQSVCLLLTHSSRESSLVIYATEAAAAPSHGPNPMY